MKGRGNWKRNRGREIRRKGTKMMKRKGEEEEGEKKIRMGKGKRRRLSYG